MKTLILFETQKGYTKSCAIKLQELLKNSVLCDIRSTDYNIDEFDIILVGTPIYEGKIDKVTRDFFYTNKWKLLEKKLAIFCAGMNTQEFNQAMQESLPGDIFLHAEIVHCGGVINYDTLKWREKRILKRRLGITKSDHLDYSHKLVELAKWANQF